MDCTHNRVEWPSTMNATVSALKNAAEMDKKAFGRPPCALCGMQHILVEPSRILACDRRVAAAKRPVASIMPSNAIIIFRECWNKWSCSRLFLFSAVHRFSFYHFARAALLLLVICALAACFCARAYFECSLNAAMQLHLFEGNLPEHHRRMERNVEIKITKNVHEMHDVLKWNWNN